MRIHINRKTLVDDLATAVGVTSRKTTIPLLSHVLFDVKRGALRLVTTDFDHTIVTTCKDVDADDVASFTVPAAKLLEIARAISADELTLEEGTTKGTIAVRGGHSRFGLHSLPGEDFPTVPELGANAKSAIVSIEALRRVISGVGYAVGEEETRFQVSGALFVWNTETLEAAATDGHRLALIERAIPNINGLAGESFLVSRRALQLIPRLAAEEVEVTLGENHLGFRAGHRHLLTRKIEGTFPDYKRVIAKENDKKLVFAREELLAAINRVKLMAGGRTNTIRIDLAPNVTKLVTANADLGEAEEEVPCIYDSGICRLGVNPKYLVDALDSLTTADVRLEAKDSDTQMVLYPEGETAPEDRQALCVVMPMRV